MAFLTRLRNWFRAQWRKSGRLGKLALLAAPILFGCCFFSLVLSNFVADPTPEPIAEVSDRAAATAELSEPTDEPDTEEPTIAPVTDEPTATLRPTTRPTNTARPTATDEPTRPPVRAATALAETVVADQLTVTAALPTATSAASTATNPPPTATAVRAATVALPTATLPPPTAPLPTAAPPTAIPPTAVPPTQPPAPTAPPAVAAGDVILASVRYNGDINPQEPDEYAVITNRGGAAVNLNGWRLNAGEPDQNFGFPSFDLGPGQSCRVYTNQVNADSCGGGTFGSGQAIWNNGGDCGVLYNAEGAEVSRYCW